MRLAVLGPSQGDRAALRKRAEHALDVLEAGRVVYLGIDGALDEVVGEWANQLVRGDPSDDAVWDRAVEHCAEGGHDDIDRFLLGERSREGLKKLECLPHPKARTIEIIEGIVTVIIHDKALLDEEDILPATLLVFGKSSEPIVHKVGARTFIAPGPLSHAQGGIALLEDAHDEIVVSIHGPDGTCARKEAVAQIGKGMRLRVKGASSS